MSLTPEALVTAAVEHSGLEDFGTGRWRDGLEVFCDALTTAGLNEVGRHLHEGRLTNALTQRLGVVDWCRRHPEIEAQPVRRPVIVVGLPRTGTTALAHLLAADPDSRPLRTWEASTPVPPPDAATVNSDPRIAATQAGIDMSHALMPDLPRLYFATATSPSEALDVLGMSFRAFQWGGQADVQAYESWLLGCAMDDAYAFQRHVHQLLQWRCPPTRWTWKNPPDLFFLAAVRSAFPDALFVWTHRDPGAALASVCSLIAVVRRLATDHVDLTALGPRQVELWADGVDRGMAAREALGEDAFADVAMADLAADPLATVAALYERLGWPFTSHAERAMRAWLAGNPRHGRGGHEPDAAAFGIDPGAIRERFAAYIRRFSKEAV